MDIEISSIDEQDLDSRLHTLDSNDLVIPVGKKSADWLHDKRIAHKYRYKALYTLLPKASYGRLAVSDSRSSAIFIDQPFERLLHFSKLISAGKPHVGVLLGPSTKQYRNRLESVASEMNIPIHFETADSSDQIGNKLRKLFSSTNLLLTLPDPEIYNRKNVVGILLSSYHNQVPVLGFSSAYVKAGALAAVYSTPEDIGKQISDTVKKYLGSNGKRLDSPGYTEYFSISTNESVGKSLGISLPDEDKLKSLLLQEESK
ncbi:ABC transporter substrate-binding protein [Solemya velesiana gill symbiont]|nr:ABC transporter substrate binding protein [Solemya velesiana gill symbiont]